MVPKPLRTKNRYKPTSFCDPPVYKQKNQNKRKKYNNKINVIYLLKTDIFAYIFMHT